MTTPELEATADVLYRLDAYRGSWNDAVTDAHQLLAVAEAIASRRTPTLAQLQAMHPKGGIETSGDGELRIYTGRVTFAQLQAMLPEAAIETSGDGELHIYTGWATNHADPEGPLVPWCAQCESGADLEAGYTCAVCGRSR